MTAVVAFISQKGGVGKSTLARAVAAVAAHGGVKVTLADLDPRQQTSVHWQKLRRAGKTSPRIKVVACLSLDEALAAGTKSDLLVLDTPAGVDARTRAIAERADLVVLPTGPNVDDLHPTVLLVHELATAGIGKPSVVVAICRVLAEDEETAARTYLQDAGVEVLAGSVPESLAYRIAHNRGHSLTETIERSLNERADALMESLLNKLGAVRTDTGAEHSRRGTGEVA